MASKGISTRLDRVATSGALWFLAAFTLLPLILIVIGSITPSGDLVTGFSVPSSVTGTTSATRGRPVSSPRT